VSCQSSPHHSSVVRSRRAACRTFASLTPLVLSFAAAANAQVPVPQPPVPVPVPVTPAPMPQQPVMPQAPQPIVGYRAPGIALVEPAAGAALPPDKAILIFRFVQGEASDPLDASSFAVSVNGAARSASFQVGASEAWGPLSDAREAAPGAYQVAARICSTRGACATTTATVTVASSEAMAGTSSPNESTSRRQRLIDLILAGLKRLVGS